MLSSQEEVAAKVTEIVMEALAVDEEEVTPEATLFGDLGMESIDMLDMVFQLEKGFGISIDKAELSWTDLVDNPQFVVDDKFTQEGLDKLRSDLPHLDISSLEGEPLVSKMENLLTIDSIVKFVVAKQAAQQAS